MLSSQPTKNRTDFLFEHKNWTIYPIVNTPIKRVVNGMKKDGNELLIFGKEIEKDAFYVDVHFYITFLNTSFSWNLNFFLDDVIEKQFLIYYIF